MCWCRGGSPRSGCSRRREADRRTLIRRLYSDLLGLPPTPEEVEAFERTRPPTPTSGWWTACLQNPHYGERMAIGWLDVVRFADTIGYHSDNPRNVWPYRDWVIRSFNDNKPFDRFTLEQIAGDLLPDANPGDAGRLGLQPPAAHHGGRGRPGRRTTRRGC